MSMSGLLGLTSAISTVFRRAATVGNPSLCFGKQQLQRFIPVACNSSKSDIDYELPKRPLTAYFFFLQNLRNLRADHNLPVGEFVKLASAKWKVLPEAEQRVYLDMAAKAKEDYSKSLEAIPEDIRSELQKEKLAKVRAKRQKTLARKQRMTESS